jgi:regulator of sirC expression with transglutaminase-like and TPR domain
MASPPFRSGAQHGKRAVNDPRTALEAIGETADAEIDLADAALHLARVDAPDADWAAARAHLSLLAREAVAMAETIDPADLPAQAAALADLLVTRQGYGGDGETYDDLANANLIRVIERRRGLPVALGVLWLHAARAAGWTAHGVDFPAHFLVALHAAEERVVIDMFGGGRLVNARELRTLLKRVAGPKAELTPDLLAPMTTRGVLLRLQNNVKARRLRGGDVAGGLASAEDMLRIAPAEPSLWREAAAMHEKLDQVTAALRCLGRFLELVPHGEAAETVRATIGQLRARLN